MLSAKCSVDGVETSVNVETHSAMIVGEFASKALETVTKLDHRFRGRTGVVHVSGKAARGAKRIQLVARGKEDKIVIMVEPVPVDQVTMLVLCVIHV